MTDATLDKATARRDLKKSIFMRAEAGYVAKCIQALGVLDPDTVAGKQLGRLAWGYSYRGSNLMKNDFRQIDRLSVADVETFKHFFPQFTKQLEAVEGEKRDIFYISEIATIITLALRSMGVKNVTAGETLQAIAEGRYENISQMPKRQAKKALRFLSRMEEFVGRMESNHTEREAVIMGKSRLSQSVIVDKLDDLSLAAIAYLVARANRRSLFLVSSGQESALDTLYKGLEAQLDDSSAWFEIAKVAPTALAFNHLTLSERATLLSVFYSKMVAAGEKLGELYLELPERTQREFITVRGCDSSRWNIYAGQYNTMRSAWINLMNNLGLESTFREFLPGKAPRIMAADVVYGRAYNDTEDHGDVRLFEVFPKPWEILSGEKKIDIEVAKQYNGWVAPLRDIEIAQPSLDPALVHGVEIGSPRLAQILRKAGVFGGNKSYKQSK